MEDRTPQPVLVRTRGLTKSFRGFTAVKRVDLDVAEGTVHALVGPNGAGKTTLFNLLTGFLTPTAGTVQFAGHDITGTPPHRIARLGIARSFQITSLFDQLTPLEHLELALQAGTHQGLAFWASQRRMSRFRGRALELLEQVGLTDVAGRPCSELAYGRKRAVELALALALEPRLLLLDEPTAGMGAEDVHGTVQLIRRVAQGRTVVLVDHNMHVVGSLAQRVTVLQAGEVLAEGTYEELRQDPRVIAAYLGETHDA